jgi:acetyltransferase-like isoleucine patch superfamily enzyme
MGTLRRLVRRLKYGRGPMLASSLRRRWLLFAHPHVDIEFRGAVYLGPGFSLHAPEGGTFVVGHGVEFRRGFRLELGPEARVEIGELTVFTYDAIVQCSTSVTIGRHCQFGQACLIVDGNHRFRDLETPMLRQGYDFRPITIADHATVLTKCTILADLGERAMVAANAVVARPVAPFTVVGGVPARELEYFGPPRG